MPPLEYLTDTQAAIYTGRPASTIRRWGAEGRLTRRPDRGRRNGIRYHISELPRAVKDPATGKIKPGKAPPLPSHRAAA